MLNLSIQIFAGFFLLLSFLSLLAVRLSEKGDIVDRNSGWVLLMFVIAVAFCIYTRYLKFGRIFNGRMNKTGDELLDEIRKHNLKRTKVSKK